MSETVVIAAAAAGQLLGAAISYVAIRHLVSRPVLPPTAARCSRCNKEVPVSDLRPWGELRMRCCADCDRQLTDRLFPDPSCTDYDPDLHRRYLQAYSEARAAACAGPERSGREPAP